MNDNSAQIPEEVVPPVVPAPESTEAAPPAPTVPENTPAPQVFTPQEQAVNPNALSPMTKNMVGSDSNSKFSKNTYDPNSVTNLGAAYAQQASAQTDLESAQEKIGGEQFRLASDSADAYNATQAKQQDAENQRQAEVKTKFDAMQKLTDDLNNNTTIDPNRLFNNMSTGSKILAGIGLVIGALGQAKSAPGSGNMGAEVINAAIDRDIQAQKDTFNNKTRSVEAQRQGFSQYMAILGDQRQAELAEKNRQLDYAKQKIDLLNQNPVYQNPVMQARLQGLTGQINESQAKTGLEISKGAYESSATDRTSQVDTTEQALKMRGLQILPATGFQGLAPDTDTAKEFRTRATEVQNTNDAIGRVRSIMAQNSYAEIQAKPELKAQVEKDVNLLNAQLVGSALKANRITAQEIHAVEKSLGNPLELFSRGSVVKAKLDAFLKDQNKDLATQAKNIGLQPAAQNNVGFKPYNYSK